MPSATPTKSKAQSPAKRSRRLQSSPTRTPNAPSPGKRNAARSPRKVHTADDALVIQSKVSHHAALEDIVSDSGSSLASASSVEEDELPPPATSSFIQVTPADAYFQAHSKPAKTSTNRLSARWTTFTPSSYLKALANIDASTQGQHKVEVCHMLRRQYQTRYRQWYFELAQGFTLLFHGLGSKRTLLNDFATTLLCKSGDVVVINGFQGGTTSISDALDVIEALSAGKTHASSTPPVTKSRIILPSLEALESRARRIAQHYSNPANFQCAPNQNKRPLYVVVHNMDGAPLRIPRAQAVFTLLASVPGIRLVASVDHVHSMVLFPTEIANSRWDSRGYNFLHHHVPTYEPYTLETLLDGTISKLFQPPLFPPTVGSNTGTTGSNVGRTGLATSKSMLHVLASLTERAKSMFKILATQQLQHYSDLTPEDSQTLSSKLCVLVDETTSVAAPISVSFSQLFVASKDSFVVSSEGQLETLLSEFRDHGIVSGCREAPEHIGASSDEREWLWICAERHVLNEVLNHLDE